MFSTSENFQILSVPKDLTFLHFDLKDIFLGTVTYPLLSSLSYSGNCSGLPAEGLL